MTEQLALVDELNRAIADSTAERQFDMVQRIADLFVFGSPDYSENQITLFDDIFTRLVASIEMSARAYLAERLAKAPLAPRGVSYTLAFDDAIDVAAPILEHSERLDNRMLADNARSKSQGHLLAISRRKQIEETVTDVLVERGDRPVVMSVAGNSGARFSNGGFSHLVKRSEGDDELVECIGSRRDLPRHHFLRLLTKASDTVRRKLEAADPLSSDAIRNAVAEAAVIMQVKATNVSRDYAAARTHVESLRTAGRLSEAHLAEFAKSGKFEETTVALAFLCDFPIEQVELAMARDRPETVLILAKAIGISWATVKAILTMNTGWRDISKEKLEQCLGTFSRLKPATARQVVEFQRRRAAGRTTKPAKTESFDELSNDLR